MADSVRSALSASARILQFPKHVSQPIWFAAMYAASLMKPMTHSVCWKPVILDESGPPGGIRPLQSLDLTISARPERGYCREKYAYRMLRKSR